MSLHLSAPKLSTYLQEDFQIDFNHPAIQEKSVELFRGISDDVKKAETAFLFVRDNIAHSGDIKSNKLTKCASEVLLAKRRNLFCQILSVGGFVTLGRDSSGALLSAFTLG